MEQKCYQFSRVLINDKLIMVFKKIHIFQFNFVSGFWESSITFDDRMKNLGKSYLVKFI